MSTPGTRAVSRICRNNPVEPVYDRAGNMTDDKFQYRYTYDAWNRLVKVEDQGMTPAVVGAYAYDGLNRRITRTIGSDDAIHEYYTESSQRIESRPGGESSTQGVSLFVFGIRYIDDSGAWASRPPSSFLLHANASGPPEERRYFLTDANYNVLMLVTDAGYGVERIFYTAYGEPEVLPFGDANGDYVVDGSDPGAASGSYKILADVNLDGVINQTDLNLFPNYTGYSGGRGVLIACNGSATTGNDIGYAGYTWNDERSQWHVRHREFDPKLGRWLQRDPAEYVDGNNLYIYSVNSPVTRFDPFGMDSGFDPSRPPSIHDYWSEEELRHLREGWAPIRKMVEEGKKWNQTDSCPEGLVPLWVCKGKLFGDDGIGGQEQLAHSYIACDNPFTTPNERVRKFGKHPRPFDSPGEWVPGEFIDAPFGPRWRPGYYRKSLFRGPGQINDETDRRDVNKATCLKRCVEPECKDKACQAGPAPSECRFFTRNCHEWAEGVCPDMSGRAVPTE